MKPKLTEIDTNLQKPSSNSNPQDLSERCASLSAALQAEQERGDHSDWGDVEGEDSQGDDDNISIFEPSDRSDASSSMTKSDRTHCEREKVELTGFMHLFDVISRFLLSFLSGKQPDIWKLEDTMHKWTLTFYEEKIELSYQWHVNKRYLRANRRVMYFIIALGVSLMLYHWQMEPTARFWGYFICNIMMVLPMIAGVAFSYIRANDRLIVYKHCHTVIACALFVTSFAWIFGQPVVFMYLGEMLVLDPLHSILIFCIYNLVITNLRCALISSSILVFSQLITCCIGLSVTSTNQLKSILSYVINDFQCMFLAYLFAFMCARIKEMHMRQIFLVRYFQKQEALIINSSLWKLKVLEEGMQALKNLHPDVSPPSSPMFDVGGHSFKPVIRGMKSEPLLPSLPPKAHMHSHHDMEPLLLDVASETSQGAETPMLRMMKSCQFEEKSRTFKKRNTHALAKGNDTVNSRLCNFDVNALNIFDSTEETTMAVDGTNDNHAIVSISSVAEDPGNHSFIHVMSELPHWFHDLALVIRSRRRQKTFGKRLCEFFEYRVCMYAGDKNIESGFKQYWSPLGAGRFQMLALSTIFGSIITAVFNYFSEKYDLFDFLVRIVYLPLLSMALIGLLRTKKAQADPHVMQTIQAVGLYCIFLGYLIIVYNANFELRSFYSVVDPLNRTPTLKLPTNETVNGEVFNILPGGPSNISETAGSTEIDWSQLSFLIKIQQSVNASIPLFDPATLLQYREKFMAEYLTYESNYMHNLNGMMLFCCFAACSSGLRLICFLYWSLCVIATLSISSIHASIVYGFDGQLLRTALAITFAVIAGIWIVRPLESEMRKWYQMKVNYSL